MKLGLTIVCDVECDSERDFVLLLQLASARAAVLLEGKSMANGAARFRNTETFLRSVDDKPVDSRTWLRRKPARRCVFCHRHEGMWHAENCPRRGPTPNDLIT